MNKKISIHNDLLPLLKLVLPLALTGIAQSANFFIATSFIAHLGQETLAAAALSSWVYATVIVISIGIMGSINVLVAHKHGEDDKEGISHILRDGMLLALLVAIPTAILLWEISPIFLVFGQNPAIVPLSRLYLHALTFSVLPGLIIISFIEFLVGIAHTRIILLITVLSVLLNLICSYVLIFGKFGFPALGIAGAGWGTTASTIITTIILTSYILLQKQYQVYCKNFFDFSGNTYLFALIKLGIPIGLMYCFEVGFFLALTLMMGTFSAVWLAANQVAMQYMGSLMDIIFSVAQAITVRMGHLLGEKKIRSSKYAAYLGLGISAFPMLIVAVFYIYFPEKLISIDFSINATNSNLVHTIKQLFIVAAIFQIFEAIRIALFGALRSLKDTRFTLFISILSFWGIAIPVGYFLAKPMGLNGVGLWWGMVIGAITSVILLSWRFKLKIKQWY